MEEIIRKIGIFSGLDEKLLRKVADTAVVCTYSPGRTVIREGDVAIGMYFILRGRVAVVRNLGGSEVRVAEIGPDQFIAETDLIDEKPRSASVVTLEPTECLLFTRDLFLRLVEDYPALSLRLARALAERLRVAQERSVASNGLERTAAASAAVGSGIKSGVQKKLVETFETLYSLKAFTRFSVAILGCPVEASAATVLELIRVGEVKVIVLPAKEPVELAIEAHGIGTFQLHVLHPDLFAGRGPKAFCFEPVPIQPEDRFTLTLPEVKLTRRPIALETPA